MKSSSSYAFIANLDPQYINNTFNNLKSFEVVLTNERDEHILSIHPKDYQIFIDYAKDVIEDPDEILKDAKHADTAFYIKSLEKGNLNVVIKLNLQSDNLNIKHSIITSFRIRNRNLKKLEQKNIIIYKKVQ